MGTGSFSLYLSQVIKGSGKEVPRCIIKIKLKEITMRVMIAIDTSDIAIDTFKFYLNNLCRPEHHIIAYHLSATPRYVKDKALPDAEKEAKKRTTLRDVSKDEEVLLQFNLHSESGEKLTELKAKMTDALSACGRSLDDENFELILDQKEGTFHPEDIGEIILKQLEANKADLIIMGCRGHAKLKKFLGSVSDHVIKNCKCASFIKKALD